jgi:hypothetical protein
MWVSALLDHSESLRAQALRCRALAAGLKTHDEIQLLLQMADEYEAEAANWEARALSRSSSDSTEG